MRVRAYEKPLLLAMLALACGLGLLVPVALSGATAPIAGAVNQDKDSGTNPGPNQAAASRIADTNTTANDGAEAVEQAPAGRGQDETAPKDQSTAGTLCQGPKGIQSLHSSAAAVAADPAGRFAFYGLPDTRTGRPGPDSHDLLRGCAEGAGSPTFLNPVAVLAAGRGPVTLGPASISARTRRSGGALRTSYSPSEGLRVVQTLQLVRTERAQTGRSPEPDTVRASYRIYNLSDSAATIGVSVVLSPARGPFGEENSRVPYFANNPAPEGAVEITAPETLSPARRAIPKEIIVPRPGAAASSTSYWRPLGQSPDRITFGPAFHLASNASGSQTGRRDPSGERGMPASSAFEASWDGLRVPSDNSLTVAYEYGQTSGWTR